MPSKVSEKVRRSFGIRLPKGWVIHHLNGDHSDDRIENLVALPKDMHDAYHSIACDMELVERNLCKLSEVQRELGKPCASSSLVRAVRSILERHKAY